MGLFQWLFSSASRRTVPACIDTSAVIPEAVVSFLRGDEGYSMCDFCGLVPNAGDRGKLLAKACMDSEPRTRSNAVSLLGKLADQSYLDTVKYLLLDPSVLVRRAAIGALRGFKDESILALLEPFCRDSDDYVRMNVVCALEQWDSAQAIAMLKMLARDRSSQVAGYAADALKKKQPARSMSEQEIRKLAESKDCPRIMDALINVDEISSIALSIELGLNDFCALERGLLIHERTQQSMMVTMVHASASRQKAGGFVCNVCGRACNLGEDSLRERFARGQLGGPIPQHEGTEKARKRIAELKAQPTPSRHWMSQFKM